MCEHMTAKFDIDAVRRDFPILEQRVNDSPLAYLDNGATTQKPAMVIDTIDAFYRRHNANVHRGVHSLSQLATTRYEHARENVRRFLNAEHAHEILFTRGTTDGINLVAASFGEAFVKPGDEIIISAMEHHANIVPWQMMCERRDAHLRVIDITPEGELDLESYQRLLSDRTRLVAITQVSNVLGTINPVAQMIDQAHAAGARVLVDGAQAVPHFPVDVRALDADFYAFSGHKLFGPTGIGILYARESLLEAMPPYQGGGNMIEKVTFEKTTYGRLPHKFEPGTPNIAGGYGLSAALDYLAALDMKAAERHEQNLLEYTTSGLLEIPGMRLFGTAAHKASVLSFLVEGTHPLDVGTILDQMGVAVRTGHHCCQPLMDYYGVPGTIRASFTIYNNREDADALIEATRRAARMLG